MKPAGPDLDGRLVVFYDGECGFCDRFVQFVLRRDRRDRFRFAPLQGELAGKVLPEYGRDPRQLETMFLLIDSGRPGERLLAKSRAALRVLREIGGPWKMLAPLGILPAALLDWGYDRIAGNRYRFGRLDACRVLSESERVKFL